MKADKHVIQKKIRLDSSPKPAHLKKDVESVRDEDDERTVFVGNIPRDTSKRTLKQHFATCGKVDSVRLRSFQKFEFNRNINFRDATFQQDKNATSIFGYVKFVSASSVRNALEKNNSTLKENILRVDKCVADQAYDPRRSIFVGNVDSEATENMIYAFFHERNLKSSGVRLVRDRASGKCKGFGFVLFEDVAAAKKAIKLTGGLVNGRPLRITPSSAKFSKKKSRGKRILDNRATGDWEGQRSRPTDSVRKLPKMIRKLAPSK